MKKPWAGLYSLPAHGLIPISIQTCALLLVYPTGKQAVCMVGSRNFEMENVLFTIQQSSHSK
jgi:hypothetical protein